MAIAFVAEQHSATSSVVSTLAVNVPAVSNGDFLIGAAYVSNSAAATLATPAGWQLVVSQASGTNGHPALRVFWRIAASEPASYNFTCATGSGRMGCMIVGYSGVNAASPIDVFSATNDPALGTNVLGTGVTTTQANDFLLAFYCSTNGSGNAFTAPSGMTERLDADGIGATQVAYCEDDELIAAAGATGDRTAVQSSSGGNGAAIMVAIKAAGGATSVGQGVGMLTQ